MKRTRGSANVFAVVTVAAGTVVAALVPGGYLVVLAIAAGDLGLAGLASVLPFMAFGGAIGFLVSGSVAVGAALLGTLIRDARGAALRRARFVAPSLGAVLALSWIPLVAPTAGAVWVFALIPAVAVGVTPWMRWPGGFMNPQAVAQKGDDEPIDGEHVARGEVRGRRRSWGDVVLVVGSIAVMTTLLLALVFAPLGAGEIGTSRGPSAVIVVGLGVIGVVIAFVSLRPVPPAQQLELGSARNGNTELSPPGDTA